MISQIRPSTPKRNQSEIRPPTPLRDRNQQLEDKNEQLEKLLRAAQVEIVELQKKEILSREKCESRANIEAEESAKVYP